MAHIYTHNAIMIIVSCLSPTSTHTTPLCQCSYIWLLFDNLYISSRPRLHTNTHPTTSAPAGTGCLTYVLTVTDKTPAEAKNDKIFRKTPKTTPGSLILPTSPHPTNRPSQARDETLDTRAEASFLSCTKTNAPCRQTTARYLLRLENTGKQAG